MSQTSSVELFLQRVAALPKVPGVSLDWVLRPSLDDEAELRHLFATDRENPRLDDPYVGLVDVFAASPDIRVTRPRIVKDDEDLCAKYVMPLHGNRRKEGSPAMAASLDEFKRNWSIFTENSLSQLIDWNNVVAAGGSVLACLTPLPTEAQASKRNLRKYFHSAAFPTSDIDLFLWGLTAEQAEVKMNSIYEAVRDSVPWDVTCLRTKHTVSIHCQYPYRSIQIILRLYKSPAEVLAGFDVDAPCCLYDGVRVWANPRAIVAMMRQCNTVDITRRSPSYEVRLAKYSSRDFEVFVPTLRRADIDPTIYERSIVRIEGLARLLVLEKLKDTSTRNQFQSHRRALRDRPQSTAQYLRRSRKHKGDLKADTSIGGLEMNDYDVASLHVPYGSGWDARRIEKLVYGTDLGMNSTFNPKNKGRRLHRHTAFFGTMQECLEDCCEYCPQPSTEEERKLQEEEDKVYIKGRVAFIEEDPGRQSMSGSFNPIDVGEWSGQVYIGQTEKFFAAIAGADRDAVADFLKRGIDVNRRDHVGRSPLHLAIMCNAVDIASDLIDAGARMMARLVDGRTALHLAAQMAQLVVIRKLFERSAVNAERVKGSGVSNGSEDATNNELVSESDHQSSRDDWSSDDADDFEDVEVDEDPEAMQEKVTGDSKLSGPNITSASDIPEDQTDQPDILDVNLTDWDLSFTPLMYAVLYGSLPVVEELLSSGGDPKVVTQSNYYNTAPFHPLALATIAGNDDRVEKIVERLLIAGGSSSAANDKLFTIFHRAVAQNNVNVVSTLLRCDPNANAALNFPVIGWDTAIFPIVTSISNGNYSILALLLAYGAKVQFTEDDISRAHAAYTGTRSATSENLLGQLYSVSETAIAQMDDVLQLLVALGADIDIGTKVSLNRYAREEHRRSLVDWVRRAIERVSDQIHAAGKDEKSQEPITATGWLGHFARHQQTIELVLAKQRSPAHETKEQVIERLTQCKNYLTDMERLLASRGAKTWKEIMSANEPDVPKTSTADSTPTVPAFERPQYYLLTRYSSERAPKSTDALYDELYEACFSGDNDKIQQLCLPPAGTHSKLAPIQVSVRATGLNATWTHKLGLSPLYAAITSRHWETARLILAIAKAQYIAEEVKEKFSIKDIALDIDSDHESTDSDDDSECPTPIEKAIDFTDIAKRPSTVRCRAPPRRLLHELEYDWELDNKVEKGNILKKAIADNDLEAFVNISDLYKSLGEEVSNDEILMYILRLDRAEILDEYLRRTGSGIDITITHKDGEEPTPSNAKRELYLGLTVHGKKRADLARKSDPNAVDEKGLVPLLWRAASVNARSIVGYLAGDRPLAAYRYYSATHSDAIAERLRAASDLDTLLPKWIGWDTDILNESPLTAAIMGNSLDSLKIMFGRYPQLMKGSLHARIKFLGYNCLMLALDVNTDQELINFLLAKGVSATEADFIRGYNIFHILCSRGHLKLLDHLLRKLPRDVTQNLLGRQSELLNTPLHVAVITGRTDVVRSLLGFTESSSLLKRNGNSFMPLHLAIKSGFAEITRLLLEVCPIEALHAENGMGETPLEMATFRELLTRIRTVYISNAKNPNALSTDGSLSTQQYFDLATQEVEIPKLRATIDQLFANGKLKRGTKTATELLAFITTMEAKLAMAKARPGPEVKGEKVEKTAEYDRSDSAKALANVRKEVQRRPGARHLVHLRDVQKSVEGNLLRMGEKVKADRVLSIEENEMDKEESALEKQKSKSLVFAYVRQNE